MTYSVKKKTKIKNQTIKYSKGLRNFLSKSIGNIKYIISKGEK